MIIIQGSLKSNNVSSFLDDLSSISDKYQCIIQSLDARYVAGTSHLSLAAKYSKRAFDRGETIAKDPAIEFILYASGRRQINRAMEMCIGPETTEIVIITYGEKEKEASDSLRELIIPTDVINPIQNMDVIRTFFNITMAELEVTSNDIESLVLERVSLLNLSK
tara:strand:+ start:7969 stop:8460 length:492 start_codon:yes stop_codon:yes gene_type:complete